MTNDTPEPLFPSPYWLIIIYEPDGPPQRIERGRVGGATLTIYDEGERCNRSK